MKPLRLGVLGTSPDVPAAVVQPSRTGLARLVSVADHDYDRAKKFAEEHGFENIHDTFEDILHDGDVEAIYNPLRGGLHTVWNLRALEAGKHVLSEKPSVANAHEARELFDAAKSSKTKFMDGFHYRYHPVMKRMVELVASGSLGDVFHVEAEAGFALNNPDDPRWELSQAGGALMNAGSFALHAIRSLGESLGGDPVVEGAEATEHPHRPGLEENLQATLRYPNGATARLVTGFDFTSPRYTLRVEGSAGLAHAFNFLYGSDDDRIIVVRGGVDTMERLGSTSSFVHQLKQFRDHVKKGTPIYTGPGDALAHAELIDAIYERAELPVRPSVELV
jgi:predicted dehydrogenase